MEVQPVERTATCQLERSSYEPEDKLGPAPALTSLYLFFYKFKSSSSRSSKEYGRRTWRHTNGSAARSAQRRPGPDSTSQQGPSNQMNIELQETTPIISNESTPQETTNETPSQDRYIAWHQEVPESDLKDWNENIQPRLAMELSQRLLKCEQRVRDFAMDFAPAGVTPTGALRSTIVISCYHEDCKKQIRKAVKQLTWLSAHEFPLQIVLDPIKLLSKSPVPGDEATIQITLPGGPHSLSGRSISLNMRTSGKSSDHPSIAILGGFVVIDSCVFGLTTAHGPLNKISRWVVASTNVEFKVAGNGDITSFMRKTAYGTPRRQRKVIQISHLQEEIDLGSDDGSVILASRTNGDHFKDWALFPIQVNHQDVHNIFFPKAYPGSIRIEGFLDHKDLTPGPVQLLSTHVSAGEAYLSGADACLFLDGRMQTFRRINLLQGHPEFGISGCWVARDSKLCGYIVAGSQEDGQELKSYVYMVPIETVISALKFEFGAKQISFADEDVVAALKPGILEQAYVKAEIDKDLGQVSSGSEGQAPPSESRDVIKDSKLREKGPQNLQPDGPRAQRLPSYHRGLATDFREIAIFIPKDMDADSGSAIECAQKWRRSRDNDDYDGENTQTRCLETDKKSSTVADDEMLVLYLQASHDRPIPDFVIRIDDQYIDRRVLEQQEIPYEEMGNKLVILEGLSHDYLELLYQQGLETKSESQDAKPALSSGFPCMNLYQSPKKAPRLEVKREMNFLNFSIEYEVLPVVLAGLGTESYVTAVEHTHGVSWEQQKVSSLKHQQHAMDQVGSNEIPEKIPLGADKDRTWTQHDSDDIIPEAPPESPLGKMPLSGPADQESTWNTSLVGPNLRDKSEKVDCPVCNGIYSTCVSRDDVSIPFPLCVSGSLFCCVKGLHPYPSFTHRCERCNLKHAVYHAGVQETRIPHFMDVRKVICKIRLSTRVQAFEHAQRSSKSARLESTVDQHSTGKFEPASILSRLGHRTEIARWTETNRTEIESSEPFPFTASDEEALELSNLGDSTNSSRRLSYHLKPTFKMVSHVKDPNPMLGCKLDTGCSFNVISQKVVERLNLQVDQYSGPGAVQLDYLEFEPIGQTTFRWNVSGRENKTYETTFCILPSHLSLSFDSLLGEETIDKIGFFQKNTDIW